MDLLQYIRVLQRWLWLLILCVVIGATIAFVISKTQTPIYQAETRLLVSQGVSAWAQGNLADSELAKTLLEMVKTERVVMAASGKLNYVVSASQVSASVEVGTRFIKVTATDTDPVRAADIANAISEKLIEQYGLMEAGRYAEYEENLNMQMTQVKSQIDVLTSQINQISNVSTEEEKKYYEEKIAEIDLEITGLNNEIAILMTKQQDGGLSSTEQLQLNSLNQALNLAQGNRTFYNNLLTNMERPGFSLNLTDNQVAQMQNTLMVYQGIYQQLMNTLQTSRTNRINESVSLEQVEMAQIPTTYVYPKPVSTALQGAIFGLVLSGGAVLVIEYLDDTIKTPDDVARVMGMRVIGFIPEIEKEKIKEGELFVITAPRSPVAEGFRALRTNLEFMSQEMSLRTFLVTSSGPGDGKSTVAANLSNIFVQGGKSVVIVDADMRRPTLHRHFKMNNRVGLSDVLYGRLNVQSVLQRYRDSQQFVITSGSLPSHPTELLGMPVMKKLMEDLMATFDIVVIDSPPFVVADAALLSSMCDGVLFVIKPGVTHSDSVSAMLEQLRQGKANVLGAIMNKVPKNRGYYYGGYRRYYMQYGEYSGYKEQ